MRGSPIKDPTARALLVAIRRGRLDLIGILADCVEELGDERGHYLRIVLREYDTRLVSFGAGSYGAWYRTTPEFRTAQWDWLRTTVGDLFGRRWQYLSHAEAARLMRPPGPAGPKGAHETRHS
jgi:hypothetical protein